MPDINEKPMRIMALTAYGLMAVGTWLGFPVLLGLVLALVGRWKAKGTPYSSHFGYVLRTFVYTCVVVFVAMLFWSTKLGFGIAVLAGPWFLCRIIRGGWICYRRQAIRDSLLLPRADTEFNFESAQEAGV